MSHKSGRTSSATDKASKLFYRKLKPALNDALPVNRVSADCRCVDCCKSDGVHKLKRLQTRKERNQKRDGGKEASKAKLCHYHCSRQSSKDISHVHQCCHNAVDKFPNIVPSAHEPSVITDSRLTGHHGLFNHEVKSIDIERLLSEQIKMNKSGQMEEKCSASLQLSAFGNPSPAESKSLSDCTNDEAGTSKEKDQPSIKTFNDLQEQENKTLQSSSQVSDLTPGQRPKKTLSLSAECDTNYNSAKQSSSDIVITEVKETQTSFHENSSKENAANQREVSHSSPVQPSSSTTARSSNNTDTQPANLSANSVAMSVKAVAANLCKSVSFSHLRKRHLVAETREVLMNALQQKHGAQLQRNIFEIQQQLHFDGRVQREVPELRQSPVFTDKEGPFGTDEFTTTGPCFASSSLDKTRTPQVNWNFTDWTNQCDETAKWLGSPVENPVGLDGTFSRRCSPQFNMDFDFQNAFSRERNHLFPHSPTSFCMDGPRSSCHSEDIFNRTESYKVAMSESTKNLMTPCDTRTVKQRGSALTSDMTAHYSFDPHHSPQSVLFPEVNGSFETYKYSFGNSFFHEIPPYQQESYSEPFRHLSASFGLRPHHVDLANYPPSHMLETGPTLSASSSFMSPEHWSFPPMRLY